MKTLGERGHIQEAIRWFDLMKNQYQVKPDQRSYELVIKHCNWLERYEEMENFYREMTKEGIPPNENIYEIVAFSLLKRGRKEEAITWFESGRDQGFQFSSDFVEIMSTDKSRKRSNSNSTSDNSNLLEEMEKLQRWTQPQQEQLTPSTRTTKKIDSNATKT